MLFQEPVLSIVYMNNAPSLDMVLFGEEKEKRKIKFIFSGNTCKLSKVPLMNIVLDVNCDIKSSLY